MAHGRAVPTRSATPDALIARPWSNSGYDSLASCPGIKAVVHVLHPGDVVCADAGDRLETLLGSCVAIVLTDPRRTIGVMCHIVHAASPSGGSCHETAHAEPALATMYALLLARGIYPPLCEAYVYGGGNMFPALIRDRHVGDSNACWALGALSRDRIRVLGHDLGGTTYRRVGWTVGSREPRVTRYSA